MTCQVQYAKFKRSRKLAPFHSHRTEGTSICGLAGYIRHPDGKDDDLATLIGLDLLLAMQARGTHATGIAVFSKDEDFIVKSAVPASVALDSEPWKQAIDKINKDTTIFLGHTRHSTHPGNTRLDEAAHPFHIGSVVGAHNGMITNWRDIWNQVGNKNQPIWMVDSQAAIGALDAINDPVKALDLLDGYWALSWVKKNDLYFARTSSGPLSVAYVPAMRTLFWCSTMSPLDSILRKAGITEYSAYDLGPNQVYRINAQKFDDHGIHAQLRFAEYAGLKHVATKSQIAVTSGKGGRSKSGTRSGITVSDTVELVQAHDRLIKEHEKMLRYYGRMVKELQDDVRVLRAVAGLTDQDPDENQLSVFK